MRVSRFALLAPAAALLSPGVAVAAEPAKSKPETEVVCKRMPVIGSLVRKEKRCMTRKDWSAVAEATRNQALVVQQTGSASGQY